MNSRPSFWKCLTAAFSARPFGMFIPPNWIGLTAIVSASSWPRGGIVPPLASASQRAPLLTVGAQTSNGVSAPSTGAQAEPHCLSASVARRCIRSRWAGLRRVATERLRSVSSGMMEVAPSAAA